MSAYKIIPIDLEEENVKTFETLPHTLYTAKELPLIRHFINPQYFKKGFLLFENETPKARIAVFENKEITYQGKPFLLLGAYECVDDLAISQAILKKAIQYGKQLGYDYVIGPLDGATWHSYRFVVHPKPPFFSEPYHHFYYNKQWEAAGFEIIQHYSSYLAPLQDQHQEVNNLESRFLKRGIKLRRLRQEAFEEELELLYDFTHLTFQNNFLYSPIAKPIFIGQYKVLQKILHPDMVWLATADEQVVGMLVAFPNYLDPQGKSFIIKTLSAHPAFRYKGVGRLLTAKVSQLAYQLGYTHAIHALMRSDNISIQVSQRFDSSLHQEYALYGRDI